jgi:formate dehydrogenase major subunit
MAECHPVAFRAIVEAKRRGATVLHVDPRFTRTSALADRHVAIRAGTDIAFLGGLIRYVLENERYFREYVVAYTNAANLVDPAFRDTEELDGLFSGYDHDKREYDASSWQYEGCPVSPATGKREQRGAVHGHAPTGNATAAPRDETLTHPRCVLQILKRHFARYTPEMVERTCGIAAADLVAVAEALCRNSGRERTSSVVYSVGWTQHSVGVQYIRAASILQLLLGNIGRPGGGVMALRGHASIQGSTDIPTLYDLLPGYLPMPHRRHRSELRRYLDGNKSASGWWTEFDKYAISLLKAWYGADATAERDYLFGRLPSMTGDHSHLTTVSRMAEGKLRGYFVIGENPAVGSVNGALQRKGLRQLEWLVVRDYQQTETSDFWRTAPEIANGEVRPEDIATEVFYFPAAAHTEKDGTYTNTQRLLQWHHKAIEPPADARSELWFAYHLGRRLKQAYANSNDPRDEGLRALTWDYPVSGPNQDPSAEAVLREINGYKVADGSPVSGFTELEDDGSTACGCWIYSGVYAKGVNLAARRKPASEQEWTALEWAWSWPSNRRILYNRASADPAGVPWSERKAYVWWDAEKRRWTGHDVPDFVVDRPPDYRVPPGAEGLATIGGDLPFLMQPDGRGWLFAPTGLADGPLPTHYEPMESVVENPLYPQQCNPVRLQYRQRGNPRAGSWGDDRFPFVLTTFRLTEHHTGGGMSRQLSLLSELQPELFCEVSPELAAERGLENTGWATITSARGRISCRVLVTDRLRPLRLGARTVHQVGIPYHWGSVGRVTGDTVNDLIGFVADPNAHIPESKVLAVDIAPGRLPARAIPQPNPNQDEGRDLPNVGQKTEIPAWVKE